MPAVLLAGLPGTGKSALAEALAEHFEGHVVNKDVIRLAVFGPSFVSYTREQDDLVQAMMVEAAQHLWSKQPGLWIFFDGRTFSRRYQRGAIPKHHTILCTAPDDLVRARLKLPHPAANRNWELHQKVRRNFEEILEPHLVVDTGRPLEECVLQAVTYLEAAQRTS